MMPAQYTMCECVECIHKKNAERHAGARAFTFQTCTNDTLAERLRRRPAKPMGSPCVGSNPTGVVSDVALPLHKSPAYHCKGGTQTTKPRQHQPRHVMDVPGVTVQWSPSFISKFPLQPQCTSTGSDIHTLNCAAGPGKRER